MTAREAFASIGRGDDLAGCRIVLAPVEQKAVEDIVMVAEAYGRCVRAGVAAMAEVGRLYCETVSREFDALADRLRETRV